MMQKPGPSTKRNSSRKIVPTKSKSVSRVMKSKTNISREAKTKNVGKTGVKPGGAQAETDYFEPGYRLRERWLLEKRIGDGAFGQVFLARDVRDKINVAIKTERIAVARKCLCMEVAVMRVMGDSTHVPYIVACGRTNTCRYIVMELLGISLFDFRHNFLRNILPLDIGCKIGLQSITAVRDLHEAGFIHRDIKPGNFAFGAHSKVISNLFMFDFGLSRIHLLANGKPRNRRKHRTGFRGTLRYASIASHKGNDLGRVDDLFPVFYILVELIKGDLPWKGLQDRIEVHEKKENTSIETLCKGMPREFGKLGQALEKASYKSQPRYDKLAGLLSSVIYRMNCDPNQPITVTTGYCVPYKAGSIIAAPRHV